MAKQKQGRHGGGDKAFFVYFNVLYLVLTVSYEIAIMVEKSIVIIAQQG